MPTNTATRYGNVTKLFHWLTALLVLMLIPLGIVANGMAYDTPEALAAKARLFSLHKTLGVLVFFVALARILWALTQVKPAPLHPERRAETFLAATVHWLLYGSLLLVPLTGWLHHAATVGFAPILWPFGQGLPFVPTSDALAGVTASLHIIFERVLVASILLHVAGALKHQFIDRDTTLKRMWFGRVEGGGDACAPSAKPFGAALAVWASALAIGATLGLFEKPESTATAIALSQVESDWQVESGTLDIRVTQLSTEISGTFADWTAAITYDDRTGTGEVEVIIAVPSLTLGSVTSNALGAEYFNANAFPTAEFTADITRGDAGHLATGTLTIRGQTVPVTFPFTLEIDGDRARMTGSLTLDRRDFGIGGDDESAVKYPVQVEVELTATNGA